MHTVGETVTHDDLLNVPLFEHLRPDQIDWLIEHGQPACVEPNEYLFHEGDDADYFYVIMSGEVQISREANGSEMILATHRAGGFSGEVPLLSGTPYVASARALRESKLLRFDNQSFREMFSVCPIIVSKLFGELSRRIQVTEAMDRQREKMMALGVLSAGLAHELNNPAAAATRASDQLRETLARLQPMTIRLTRVLDDYQMDALITLRNRAADALAAPDDLDPLTRSDREDEIADWLDEHGVDEGWEISPLLVTGRLTVDDLDTLAESLNDESVLRDVIGWLRNSLDSLSLLRQVEQSSKRISELVKAVKSYSFMDQAPLQEIDIHTGIEDTLTIMAHKLKSNHITVHKEYAKDLPHLYAYGSELNQVWTNIIDNAVDAMVSANNKGTLTIRTWADHEDIWVEIADDGPGIPEDIRTRVFEPFFTTKPVGKGTGLGLDIAHRTVVVRHHGEILVESQPGETKFQIRLPMQQESQKRAAAAAAQTEENA